MTTTTFAGRAQFRDLPLQRLSARPTLPRMPSRKDAWDLLCEWTTTDPLRKHGLAVEAAVGWYGENKFGISGDELEIWRSAGVAHAFGYERLPGTHPPPGADEL